MLYEVITKSIAKITYNNNNVFGANQKLALNIPQLNDMSLAVIKAPVSKNATKNRALIYNKDLSIQRYVANGSNISEVQKNITNQTEIATISEISGYGCLIESFV